MWGFCLYIAESQFVGLIYLVHASLPTFYNDQLHVLLPVRLARISTEDNMLTTLIQKGKKPMLIMYIGSAAINGCSLPIYSQMVGALQFVNALEV